jgi:hypothetical protein
MYLDVGCFCYPNLRSRTVRAQQIERTLGFSDSDSSKQDFFGALVNASRTGGVGVKHSLAAAYSSC